MIVAMARKTVWMVITKYMMGNTRAGMSSSLRKTRSATADEKADDDMKWRWRFDFVYASEVDSRQFG